MMSKLYVVTRQDLSPGQQAVQSCHAVLEFAFEFS
jgi:peptidyl-tRNA hydrolase